MEISEIGKVRYDQKNRIGEFLEEGEGKLKNVDGTKEEMTLIAYASGNKLYTKESSNGKEEKKVEENDFFTFVEEGLLEAMVEYIKETSRIFSEVVSEPYMDVYLDDERDKSGIVFLTAAAEASNNIKFLIDDTDTKYTKLKITYKENTSTTSIEGEEIFIFTKNHKILAYKGEIEGEIRDDKNKAPTCTEKISLSIVPWSGTIQKPNDLHTYPAAE